MEKRYIFVEPNGDISRWIFQDLEHQPDVDVLLKPAEISNDKLKLLKRIHFSRKLNQLCPLPFKGIWDRFYTLEGYPFQPGVEYYIVIGNFAITEFRLGYLEKLRRRYGAKIVLYFMDPVSSEYSLSAFESTKKFRYDYVYTFDRRDAKTYGFLHTGPLYSVGTVEKGEKTKDLYFVGVNKNRLPVLRQIHQRLTASGLRCDFYVAAVEDKDIREDGIIYNERCSYADVVKQIQSYGAILDVIQEGQAGVSLRYFEAVAHDRKLITNNPTVKDYPYYTPENILVFEKPEDIDPQWLRTPCKPNHYAGDFTPVNWVRRIGTE